MTWLNHQPDARRRSDCASIGPQLRSSALVMIVQSSPVAASAFCNAAPAVKLGAMWFVVTTLVISDCVDDVEPMILRSGIRRDQHPSTAFRS